MAKRRLVRGLSVAVVVCAGLIVLYQVLIWEGMVPAVPGRTLAEDNRVRAEGYAFADHEKPPDAIVGSSLTNRLYLADQADWGDAYNLSMVGKASPTGLELLLRTPAPPGRAAVEVSFTLARGLDHDIVDGIYGYGLFEARKQYPVLQTRYRPVGVALAMVTGESGDGSSGLTLRDGTTLESATSDEAMSPADERQRELSVTRLRPDQMKKLTPQQVDTMRKNAEAMKGQLARLNRAGWRILLCDIPRDARLADTVQRVQIQSLLAELFPRDQYHWAPPAPERDWATRDGNHLVPADARRYGSLLRQALDALP